MQRATEGGRNTTWEDIMKGFILYLIGISLAVKLVSLLPQLIHGMIL
jgi:hypothetical protein